MTTDNNAQADEQKPRARMLYKLQQISTHRIIDLPDPPFSVLIDSSKLSLAAAREVRADD